MLSPTDSLGSSPPLALVEKSNADQQLTNGHSGSGDKQQLALRSLLAKQRSPGANVERLRECFACFQLVLLMLDLHFLDVLFPMWFGRISETNNTTMG
jgi:hypothetical protein